MVIFEPRLTEWFDYNSVITITVVCRICMKIKTENERNALSEDGDRGYRSLIFIDRAELLEKTKIKDEFVALENTYLDFSVSTLH